MKKVQWIYINIKNIIDTENIDCDFEFQNNYIYTTDANGIKKIKDEKTLASEKMNGRQKDDKIR